MLSTFISLIAKFLCRGSDNIFVIVHSLRRSWHKRRVVKPPAFALHSIETSATLKANVTIDLRDTEMSIYVMDCVCIRTCVFIYL